MAWALLAAAGLLEIVWATALKESNGFTRLGPATLAVIAAISSFAVLAVALQRLPVGTAYAVWVGIGAGGLAVVGMIHFGDTPTPQRLACIALVLSGVIGLRVIDG